MKIKKEYSANDLEQVKERTIIIIIIGLIYRQIDRYKLLRERKSAPVRPQTSIGALPLGLYSAAGQSPQTLYIHLHPTHNFVKVADN